MQHITLDDQVYQVASTDAARLNLSVDTYLSTLIMKTAVVPNPENGAISKNGLSQQPEPLESIEDEVSRRIREAGSPAKALFGLFADEPELVDAVLADIMESRSKRWRLPDEKSTS